jgi:hypothetical protein
MQTLMAASTGTLTYPTKADDVLVEATSCALVITDADGETIDPGHEPTWVADTGYVVTVDAASLPVALVGTRLKLAWTWVYDGETRRDVEYAYVDETDRPNLLATPTDLVAYGYDIDADKASSMLARASVRVRAYTKQDITSGTSTVTLRAPFLLPQRPVVSVTSVTDEDDNTLVVDTDYTVRGQYIVSDYKGELTVTYTHGFTTLPDRLVEVVCAIAFRLANSPHGLDIGVQSEGADGESITWGSDAYAGVADLTRTERDVLDKLFPHTRRVPSVVHTL